MTANRWAQVESISVAAMERDDHERRAFLDEACGGDEALRREVESLLGYADAAEDFLQRPALEEAARTCAVEDRVEPDNWQIAGYETSALLGAGGMGEVYRARDLRLEREVAVKVVRSITGDHASVARFEEEARVASGLNHPNIVTIYGVGNQDDVAYIVMELVHGRTLRAMLAKGALSLATTLDVAVQLADGLTAAHAAGIVHRDLKPENVMVTPDGLVKILDFGIAKRERGLSVAAPIPCRDPSPVGSSETSTISGTAGYMSPEQAARRSVDHRADQFSFGAIVYEMLCGRRAFERDSKAATIDAIVNEDHQPIQDLNGHVTTSLSRIIERCLAKDPRARYPNTRDLAVDVHRLREESTRGVQGSGINRRHAIWLGGAGIVGAAVSVAGWRLRPHGPATRRLAVLPFANVLGDEDTEYLCDGITEVLIRQLARMPALTVMARSTVFQFKGKRVDPREAGQQLSVGMVLNGSVTRRGGRAQINAELVEVATGVRLWGDVFDRSEADVLAIQDEIASAIISNGLQLPLNEADRRQLTGMLTGDADAYQLFLRAVHHFRLETEPDYLAARELLQKAVALDNTFALAHVTLASTYSVMAIDGFEPPHVAWPQSRLSVGRALKGDPTLPDALAERATEAFFYQWDWTRARNEWDAALKSGHSEVQAELLTSYVLQQWALGRDKEALQFAQAARLVDPLSAMLAVREGDLLAKTGQLERAASVYGKVIGDMPGEQRAYFGLADVRRLQGRLDEAIEVWRRAYAEAGDESFSDVLSTVHGASGFRDIERAMANRELDALRARAASGAYVSPLDLARSHSRLGEREQAFSYFADAFDDRAAALVFLNVDRAWDNIRDDPRFAAAVRQVGLA